MLAKALSLFLLSQALEIVEKRLNGLGSQQTGGKEAMKMNLILENRRLWFLVVCLLSTVSSGCVGFKGWSKKGFKIGPDYCKPVAAVSNEWIDSESQNISLAESASKFWWTQFNDPSLDRLIETAYAQNLTLREAAFRVSEAQSLRGVVAGNLLPQFQQVQMDYTRVQRSSEVALFPSIPPGSPFGNLAATEFSNWRLGGSLAWELDFWGRYRRAIEAADARLESSVEGYDDALVLLIGEVASAYIEMRTVEQRLEVAQENLNLQEESRRVAEARLASKSENSELDTPQARALLGNTRAAIESLQLTQRRTQNRLSVLMGMPPQDLSFMLGEEGQVPRFPEGVVEVGVPADLLWKRPDVRRAERLVAAKSAEIGVAMTDLYPHISIVGSGGWEAGQFKDVFKSSAFGGSIGPTFRWNVLNYYRIRNNINAQEAQFQQLIAAYQQTVLRANEEAENSITAYLKFTQQIKVLEESTKEAAEAERVAQIKYREGEIDFNRLFNVQQLLLLQQEALVGARGSAASALVDLYRALGGGWEIRLETAPSSPSIVLNQ